LYSLFIKPKGLVLCYRERQTR